MTSLKEIETLYYKAIEDAKLDEPAGRYLGPPGYSTGDFTHWARKVDIFTLGEEAADFALKEHEEIVKEFGKYRQKLAERLSKIFSCDGVYLPGQLRDIGSCWDGSKVGVVNEMDSLYVIQGDHFLIQEHREKRGAYRVLLQSDSTLQEIKPRTIRDQFTQKYSQLVHQLKLPNCLGHGGYKAARGNKDRHENPRSRYSGVRYNGPAATSQFLTTDKTLLTWDMTPVIVLPLDVQAQEALRQSMQAIIADNPDKMFPPSDVHLIPDVVENVWRQSTALMEADILRVLSKEGAMKKSLSFCKVLSSRLKGWVHKFETDDTTFVDIINELLRNLAMEGGENATEELERKMRFGHIWLPSDKKEEFHEDTKSSISLNNAAIKHILFKAAFKKKGAFGSQGNMDLVIELIKEVFEVLGNEEVYTTEHAFLPGIRISHFSVSPIVAHKKQTLARDVCRQCRTLVQEAMTEPSRTTEIDLLVGKLNKSFSKPAELRCGEYSFQLKMNPWQHPIFDENIHHLFAMLTSLCCGCGGVIYFVTDDAQLLTEKMFQVYKERLLHTLLVRDAITSHLPTNVIQISLPLGAQRSWAALLLKRSNDILKSPLLDTKGIWKTVVFHMDMFGQICTKNLYTQNLNYKTMERSSVSGQATESYSLLPNITRQTEPEISAGQGRETERPMFQQDYCQEMIPHRIESETLSTSMASTLAATGCSDSPVTPQVDFSSCKRLDWTENTKDWQKYVNIKDVKADDIVSSCPMWKPTRPMKITPDRDALKYLFVSEEYLDETLSTVTTFDPGCAVVCRTWRFHVSDGNITPELPPGHICDILTVTATGRLTYWVIVNSLDEETIRSQMDYLMTTGRMLKYQIIQKGEDDDLSNLWIECRLLPCNTSRPIEESVIMRLSESQEIQAQLYHMYQDGVDFALLQRALTKLILSKESPLKRCIGEHTSINLSAQQVEVLMHKAKVNYITGPAGSGKSYTGTFLYKMYGTERSVYICTTKAFLEYLDFNGCRGTLVCCDQDLLNEIKSGTFENKTCIVIDDCHKFACTTKSMKELFKLLKTNRDMSLFVFADNDYQSFNRKRQQAMHDCILDLTRTVLQQVPLNLPLTDIYRNTRKIVSFVQAAIQDVHDGHQKIESVNLENGEGVECITMPSLWKNSPDNDLVVFLRSLLSSENYRQSEVAILFESSFSPDRIQQCKKIVEENIPRVILQSADLFPRRGVIVDNVNSFLGLDASVCVFILSNTSKKSVHQLRTMFNLPELETNMYNPRYEVFLASRAIHKAIFVVPELHKDLVQQMKFDRFQLPAQFQGLRMTRRHRIQWGDRLWGFCSDGNRLYCVEKRRNGNTFWLTVYGIGTVEGGGLSLMDKEEVGDVSWVCLPRIDSSHRVYVPCGRFGVRIFRYQDCILLPAREPLRCVDNAMSICVNTADTVLVADATTESVCLVNVPTDTVIRRLGRPAQVQGYPNYVSVRGQTVLVCYDENTLVTYRSDRLTLGQVLQPPEGLGTVSSITTDSHSSSFLITDYTGSVFVLDDKLLWHRIYTGGSGLHDCAVVQSQVWVGCDDRDIHVLTSH